jgi:hypothetical protein
MDDLSELFIVSIPTHDERTVGKSLVCLMSVSAILGRKFLPNIQFGTNVSNVRTKCVDAIRKAFPNKEWAYMFWIDSDIIINEDPAVIAKYVLEAEKSGVSFTGNYKAMDMQTKDSWNIAVKNEEPYTDNELGSAKPFELKCKSAGLGLCYIKTPLNYSFRDDGHDLEDLLFFKDNPQIDLRYVPIKNSHIKSTHLDGI